MSKAEVAYTLDAQGSFHVPGNYFYDFSQGEEYILNSIRAMQGGGDWLSYAISGDAAPAISTDYNSFGILVYVLFTAIFGTSTFGLRLPSFLSSFGVFLLLYFLGKKLFKNDKWGLALSVLFGIGGTFFTVGRTGTPAALALLAVVGCIYCMYLFFANGVDSKHPVKGALPVLFSGLCFGVALATQTMAAFPCVIAVVLFAFGLIRLFSARRYERDLAEKEERNAPMPAANGTESVALPTGGAQQSPAAAAVDERFSYKLRMVVAFFAVAFVGFPVLLLCVSGIPTYYAYAAQYLELSEYSTDVNYLTVLLQQGLAQCFTVSDVTSFTETNAFTPASWLLALRGATVYSVGDTESLSQINVQANVLLTLAAAVAFLFSTVYVIARSVKYYRDEMERKDIKKYKSVFRAYIGLLLGAAACWLPFFISSVQSGNVSAEQSYWFELFYLSFIVLAFYILETPGRGKEKGKTNGKARAGAVTKSEAAMYILLGVSFVLFIFSTPMYFGWGIGETAVNVMYNWTAVLSNGYYGIW